MDYTSTRGQDGPLGYEEALLSGLARDGGLYLPVHYPHFMADEIRDMAGLSYAALAGRICAALESLPARQTRLHAARSPSPLTQIVVACGLRPLLPNTQIAPTCGACSLLTLPQQKRNQIAGARDALSHLARAQLVGVDAVDVGRRHDEGLHR